jgi:hypothetical protein
MTHAPQNPNESEAASESTPKHVDLADADLNDEDLEAVAGGHHKAGTRWAQGCAWDGAE